jgi:Kef-type K+ transport system membrane component KefB
MNNMSKTPKATHPTAPYNTPDSAESPRPTGLSEATARRLTGVAGIATALALIVEVPLYFVYSGPPPDANVLARLLIGILALASLIVFVTSFRELVKRVNPAYEWAASLAYSTGLVYATIILVSMGLEAGAVIATDHSIDPTIDVNGTYILYGSISRLLLALFLTATAYTIARTNLLPRWTTRSAYVLAGINLAFVPSLFFGNTPADFYAANGWGTTASMGAILSYWLLALGISTYRSGTTKR